MISAFVQDAKRFVPRNRYAIDQFPLQTYFSCLMFLPRRSIIREYFLQDIPWMERVSEQDDEWDACLQTSEGHSDAVVDVAVSHDGKILATGSKDTTVKLWDATSGHAISTLEGHSDYITTVAFSSDGRMVASASADRTVRLWDIASGETCSIFKSHSFWVHAVVFSPDDTLLGIASTDDTTGLWNIRTGVRVCGMLEVHSNWCNAVAFSPDGNLVATASSNKTLKLWIAATGITCNTFDCSENVDSVDFSPDGKFIAFNSDYAEIQIWNIEKDSWLTTLECAPGGAKTIAFSPNGKLLASAGSGVGTIEIWDASNGELLNVLLGHSGSVRKVAFAPTGEFISSASYDNTVRLWDTARCATRGKLEESLMDVISVSCDSRLVATASEDRVIKVVDSTTGTVRDVGEHHSGYVTAVTISGDGSLIASASTDATIKLWDTRYDSYSTLEGHSKQVKALAFSPDGKFIASASLDHAVRMWNVARKSMHWTLDGHNDLVTAVAFSPDSGLVVAGSQKGKITISTVLTGDTESTLWKEHARVDAVSFSPDGQILAALFDSRTVRLWHVSSQSMDGQIDLSFDTKLRSKRVVHAISFSGEILHLETRFGYHLFSLHSIYKPSKTATAPTQTPMKILSRTSNLFSIDDDWIYSHGKRLLWLPTEFRPRRCTIRKDTVFIICRSGRFCILKFDQATLPWGIP